LVDTDLNKVLQQIPLKQQIENLGSVDYSLVAAPAIGGNFVCVSGKGLFMSASSPSPPPFGPTVPLPDLTNAGYMAQFFLSDFVGNSLFYALYKSGILNYKIDSHNVPAGFPKFNTDSFEFVIPSLFFKYPNYDMSATFVADQSPKLIVNNDPSAASFNLSAVVDAEFYVVPANMSQIPVFTLEIAISGYAVVSVTGNIVRETLMSLDVSMELKSSNIGTFSTAALEVLANTALNNVIVPEINNMTKAGLPIPVVDGVQLVNPVITSSPGYFIISSNVQYNGASKHFNVVYAEDDV